MIFTQPLPSSGLAHGSATNGISRSISGSISLRPSRAMSRSCSSSAASSRRRTLRRSPTALQSRPVLCRSRAASFSVSSALDLVQCRRRDRDARPRPYRPASFPVAWWRSSRASARPAAGSITGYRKCQKWPFTASWNTSSSLTAVCRNVSQLTSRLPR